MKQKVLLVNDGNESCLSGKTSSLSDSLSSEAYDVVLVKSFRYAIAKSDAGEIDLVLMNLESPTEEGWTAINKITRDNPFVPVVVISSQPELRNPAEAAGICAFVEKPVDLVMLLRTIRELLAEPFQKRVARVCNCISDFRHLPSSSRSEHPSPDFHDVLHGRSMGPFDYRLPTSRWEISK